VCVHDQLLLLKLIWCIWKWLESHCILDYDILFEVLDIESEGFCLNAVFETS